MRLAQIAAVVLINAWALALGGALKQSRAPGPRAARQTGEAPFPASVSFHPDLAYCTPDPATRLELDLARPAGKRPFPAVVFIHGGGWLVGSRKTYLPHMTRLVEEGYVAVSVSYRLGRKNPFPAPVHDVKCAVRWLRAHAGTYGIDPGRVGVVGYSAGGHLACLLGTTHGDPFLEGEGGCAGHSSRVQAVVSYHGPADLAALHESCERGELPLAEHLKMSAALHGFLGGTPREVARHYALASPVTHATRAAAPTLLIHGTRDEQVPPRQSLLLEARLRQAGAEVSLLRVPDAPHDFEGDCEKGPTEAMLRFLARHLKRP